jgi:hypothetical protein
MDGDKMDTGNSILQGSEEEIRGAIHAFEEILEAMPTDRVALETLFEGHLMLDQHDKAAEFLARLAVTILEENDSEALQGLLPALHQHSGMNADVAAALNQAEAQLSSPQADGPKPKIVAPANPTPESADLNITLEDLNNNDITAELSMAWNVHQAGEISEEEYATVVHDLSELSSRQLDVPVTVLHVLEDRNSPSLDRVLQFVVRDTNTPFIKLSRFDLDPASIHLRLPEPMVRSRGALVYEVMAKDAMVAILNPYDEELKKRVQKTLGVTCHFFLTSSEEYDAALIKLYTALPEETDFTRGKGEGSGKKLGLRLKN